MPHSLILGMTESGKSTLAKRLAAGYVARDIPVLVLDPLFDPGWSCEFQTHDPEYFLDVFWESRSCAVFIDEAGDSVGKYDQAMIQTATRGRHWGHNCHYITQRGAGLARTVRDQCSHLFLFATALADAKIHATEWNNENLKEAHSLARGEYFHCTRFGELGRKRVF